MENYLTAIETAANYIRDKISVPPEVGIVLGSGWGAFADHISNPVRIHYSEVPGFPVSGVKGHAGEWVCGSLSGKQALVMSGRFHSYEGYDLKTVTLPIRVMKALGVKTVILTNAAGGVNASYEVGDLMLIADHINMTGRSPLTGPNLDALGERFPDMSAAYDRQLRSLAHAVATRIGFALREGVYAQMSGPSFETPAEIRMLRTMGADAVGMSTVPEAIVARHGGMRVMGISCITNMAAGVLDQPLSHMEVIEAGRAAAGRISQFLEAFVNDLR